MCFYKRLSRQTSLQMRAILEMCKKQKHFIVKKTNNNIV